MTSGLRKGDHFERLFRRYLAGFRGLCKRRIGDLTVPAETNLDKPLDKSLDSGESLAVQPESAKIRAFPMSNQAG
jgi:chromosome segregation ATPase